MGEFSYFCTVPCSWRRSWLSTIGPECFFIGVAGQPGSSSGLPSAGLFNRDSRERVGYDYVGTYQKHGSCRAREFLEGKFIGIECVYRNSASTYVYVSYAPDKELSNVIYGSHGMATMSTYSVRKRGTPCWIFQYLIIEAVSARILTMNVGETPLWS
jgi:hypothetical protein